MASLAEGTRGASTSALIIQLYIHIKMISFRLLTSWNVNLICIQVGFNPEMLAFGDDFGYHRRQVS